MFDSPEWVLLDMGVITEEDGIKKMISRLDTEEEKELAVEVFRTIGMSIICPEAREMGISGPGI